MEYNFFGTYHNEKDDPAWEDVNGEQEKEFYDKNKRKQPVRK